MSAWKEMMMAKTEDAYWEARRDFESECREDDLRDRDYFDRVDDCEDDDDY